MKLMIKDNVNPQQTGSRTATPSPKTYSAKELAEVLVASPSVFKSLNLKEQTNNWNLNYISDFFYYIRVEVQIDFLMKYMVAEWAKNEGLLSSFEKSQDRQLREQLHYFEEDIISAKMFVMNKIKQEEEQAELSDELENIFGCSNRTTVAVPVQQNETNKPNYSNPNANYHMSDLPEDVQKILILKDDETYSAFVENMNGGTWEVVDSNKSKYLDRLRFVCNKFEITAKKTDRILFDKLLHYIIPNLGDIGNLVSAMKKQTDSNDDSNYVYYDNAEYSKRCKCSKLCYVGAELEDCLSPVLEKIHNKKWNVKKNPR